MKLRRVVFGLTTAAVLLAGTAAASAAAPARLSVSGSNVVDPAGNPIVLRGYNWGQWGTVQPQDPGDNAAAGANSVRIPLRWWGEWKDGVDSRDPDPGNPSHIDAAHLALLDQTIKQASDAHLWITLFVDSDYGQGAGGRPDNFWTNPVMKQQFKEVWQFLVRRYKTTPYMGMLEILPEPKPIGQSDAQVRAFYDEMTLTIRGIDKRTPIVVGPNDNYSCSHLEGAYTTVDPKIVYTCNYFIFDNPLNRIKLITDFRAAHNVPVWINQVGIESGDVDAKTKARTVLQAFEDNNIGWAWWTYRISGTNPDTHGIYYADPNEPDGWHLKPAWLALVNGFLVA
ncbi:glycoside hydrolase family 5 protein [Lentzea aerocolonigenes]|uniref:glycoside hydrolase family 5 protein n=1 Tax=Lentzea aerocolonigenes TaxID=68170 RepID=UPI0009E54D2B|nr:cellulase family glycosylhydrolase [Lentzea aerocolonigenes]